jgi:hypothetical protein
MAQVRGGDFTGDLSTVPAVGCKFRILSGTTPVGTTQVFSNIHQDDFASPSTVSYGTNDGLITGVVTMAAGTTTVKLQFSSATNGNNVVCVSSACSITYFKMGA